MILKRFTISILALVLGVTPALAQDQPAQTPSEQTVKYEDLPNGTLYNKETFKDWILRCQKDVNAPDKCQLQQLLAGPNGGTVAQILIFDLPNSDGLAVAGATVTVPLETALREGLRMQIDDKQPKGYPFTFCDRIGCHARIGFTAVELKWLQDGKKAVIRTVPYTGDRQPVLAEISLAGFTAGYKAVVANNQP